MSATRVANRIRHRSHHTYPSVTNHWRVSGYPRTPSSIDLIIPPAPVRNAGLYEQQLCIISYLSSRIVFWYLWKSHALLDDHLSVQITPQPPHHCRHCNQVLLVILFKIQIFFLEQFCDLLLKRNEFFLSLIYAPAYHAHTHMYHKSPHPQSLVRAGLIAFHSHAFRVSPTTSFLLFHHHYTQCSISSPLLFLPQPPNPLLSIYSARSESHVLYLK